MILKKSAFFEKLDVSAFFKKISHCKKKVNTRLECIGKSGSFKRIIPWVMENMSLNKILLIFLIFWNLSLDDS